jgi:hypothetical protein
VDKDASVVKQNHLLASSTINSKRNLCLATDAQKPKFGTLFKDANE